MTSWAEYYGAAFPPIADVTTGVQYGPTGADYTGTSAGGGDTTVQVQAAIVETLHLGASGWFTYLHIGSAYTTENGGAYQITIKDAAGTALTALGEQDFGAATFRCSLQASDTVADFVGTLTWVPPSGGDDGVFLLEFAATETAKAVKHKDYVGQLILWPGTDHEMMIAEICFEMRPTYSAPS